MELTEIQKLYQRIPSFSCKEGCTRCCDNWVQSAPEEAARCSGFDFCERNCPKLTESGCSVYENRPLICRLFASSELMPCPYGFGPEKPLSAEETKEILQIYLRLKKEQEKDHGKSNQ